MPAWLTGLGYTALVAIVQRLVSQGWRKSVLADLELARALEDSGAKDGARFAAELRSRAYGKARRGLARRDVAVAALTRLPMTAGALVFCAALAIAAQAGLCKSADAASVAVMLAISALSDLMQVALGKTNKGKVDAVAENEHCEKGRQTAVVKDLSEEEVEGEHSQ